MNILPIIISLTIIYGILVYILLKKVSFKKMIYLSISILVFFIFLQIKIFDSLGYPVTSDLPKSFDILYVKKSESQFIVLIKDLSDAAGRFREKGFDTVGSSYMTALQRSRVASYAEKMIDYVQWRNNPMLGLERMANCNNI